MSETSTPNVQDFDREDDRANDTGILEQWSVVGARIGVPSARDLAKMSKGDQIVADRIAGFMASAREGILDIKGLASELKADYQSEIRHASKNNDRVRGADIANAWLKVLYRRMTEQDIRSMFNDLPVMIHPANGDYIMNAVRSSTVSTGTSAFMVPAFTPGRPSVLAKVHIDFQHPVWSSGSKDEIKARLKGKSTDEVGVTCIPPITGVFSDPQIEELLKWEVSVIDPKLSMTTIRLENVPRADSYTLINIPLLFRRYPEIAGYNRAGMEVFLTANPRIFEECVYSFDRNGNPLQARSSITQVLSQPVRPTFGQTAQAMFRLQSRNMSEPFAQRNVAIEMAINNRAASEQLFNSTADNRELMLALTTVQRDPTAIEVLNAAGVSTDKLRVDIDTNETRLNAVHALQELKTAGAPQFDNDEITHGKSAMDKIIQNAADGIALAPGDSINLVTGIMRIGGVLSRTPASGGSLSTEETTAAIAMGVATSLTRKFVPGSKSTPAQDNADAFNKIIEKAEKGKQKYEEAENKSHEIDTALQTMATLLNAQEIDAATILSPALYPQLHKHFNLTVRPFAVRTHSADSHTNVSALNQEFRRLLLQGNTAKSLVLQEASVYEEKRKDLGKKYDEASNAPKGSLSGSDACWAVVQRGLEHQGLRGKELQTTLEYMRNQLERSPESIRDLDTLTLAEFPYSGDEDADADKNWNKGRDMAFVWRRKGLRAWSTYRTNLVKAQKNNYGMSLDDDPFMSTYRIPQLLNVYFQTKHLMNLPEEDPHHLPKSTAMIARMRLFHRAILDRAQHSIVNATGMRSSEIDQLRAAGMGGDEKKPERMTMTERMQAVHDFLHENAYIEANKPTMDIVAENAWSPVGKKVEEHQKRVKRLKGEGSIVNPITWPGKVIGVGRKGIGGVGKGVSGTAGVWKKNWRAAAVGGVFGFLAFPGVIVPAAGIAAAPFIKAGVNKFMADDKQGGAPNAKA